MQVTSNDFRINTTSSKWSHRFLEHLRALYLPHLFWVLRIPSTWMSSSRKIFRPLYGLGKADSRSFVQKPDPCVDWLLDDCNAWKFVILQKLKDRVLREARHIPARKYFEIFKTYSLLQSNYYWPGIQRSTSKRVRPNKGRGCEVN